MPDLTLAQASKYDALRQVKQGADLTLKFLKYSNTSKFDTYDLTIDNSFQVISKFTSKLVEGKQVGNNVEILQFADVDGLYYRVCKLANACLIDDTVYKMSIKTKPRKYSNDDTDFSRVWEWFLTDTGAVYTEQTLLGLTLPVNAVMASSTNVSSNSITWNWVGGENHNGFDLEIDFDI